MAERNRHLVREQPHQERAFECYYSLGERRSYDKVAHEFGVATSTVKTWGRSFGWKQRIQEREIEIAREVASRTISNEVSYRERNLKIVNAAMARLAKGIVDGTVRMNMGDLDRLIRLESFLRDEPDSRQEIVFPDLRDKSREELREMVRQEMETLKELEGRGGN